MAKAAAAKDEEHDDETGPPTVHTTFATYVDNSFKSVKDSDAAFKQLRVANRIREMVADFVKEYMVRIAVLARITVQGLLDVRTLNAKHIIQLMNMMMADEGRAPEEIDELVGYIQEKLDRYHSHLGAEKQRKWEDMPADKKAELEEKRSLQETDRKTRAADAARKRAIAAATRAKELQAELAQ